MHTILALILITIIYGDAAEANPRQNFPFNTLSKQDHEKVHPRIFKYSPFERRCQSAVAFPVTDDLYLLVPNCSSDSRDNDPNVTYYNAQKDTWKLGPKHERADTVYDATRVSQHEFKILLRKNARMKGVIGSIYQLFREPSWIRGDWEYAEEFVCILNINSNTYSSCSTPDPVDTQGAIPQVETTDRKQAPAKNTNPRLADELTGVYKRQFKTGLMVPNRKRDQQITVEDVIELVKVANGKLYFRIELVFYNGHSCSIYGIAHQDENSFVYTPTGHDESCKLVIKKQSQDLFIDDKDTCQFACGARASLSEYTIPLTKKRPIKYLPLLLKSEEYKDAIYEDQLNANESQKDSP